MLLATFNIIHSFVKPKKQKKNNQTNLIIESLTKNKARQKDEIRERTKYVIMFQAVIA